MGNGSLWSLANGETQQNLYFLSLETCVKKYYAKNGECLRW